MSELAAAHRGTKSTQAEDRAGWRCRVGCGGWIDLGTCEKDRAEWNEGEGGARYRRAASGLTRVAPGPRKSHSTAVAAFLAQPIADRAYKCRLPRCHASDWDKRPRRAERLRKATLRREMPCSNRLI